MPYVNIKPDNLRVYYEEYGSENTSFLPILVCHGGPGMSDHNLYRRFWPELAEKGFRIILFDMRGHGLTEDGNESLWTLQQWGNDIYNVCQALELEKPIIAGVSFGGWVIQAYATNPDYQTHPSGLILCNTEAKLNISHQMMAYQEKALKVGKTEAEAKKIAETVFLNSNSPTPEIAIQYRQLCMPLQSVNSFTASELNACRKNTKLATQFYKKEHLFNFTPNLKNICCPVLVLAGNEDPEHPPIGVKEMAQEIPSAELKVLSNGADPVYLDAPAETMQHILEFGETLNSSFTPIHRSSI